MNTPFPEESMTPRKVQNSIPVGPIFPPALDGMSRRMRSLLFLLIGSASALSPGQLPAQNASGAKTPPGLEKFIISDTKELQASLEALQLLLTAVQSVEGAGKAGKQIVSVKDGISQAESLDLCAFLNTCIGLGKNPKFAVKYAGVSKQASDTLAVLNTTMKKGAIEAQNVGLGLRDYLPDFWKGEKMAWQMLGPVGGATVAQKGLDGVGISFTSFGKGANVVSFEAPFEVSKKDLTPGSALVFRVKVASTSDDLYKFVRQSMRIDTQDIRGNNIGGGIYEVVIPEADLKKSPKGTVVLSVFASSAFSGENKEELIFEDPQIFIRKPAQK